MDRTQADAVVDQLRRWNVLARTSTLGLDRAAVRVTLPKGREALWETDAGGGLTAQVLRDGMLVGCVAAQAGTEGLTPPSAAWTIANADYDLAGLAPEPDVTLAEIRPQLPAALPLDRRARRARLRRGPLSRR